MCSKIHKLGQRYTYVKFDDYGGDKNADALDEVADDVNYSSSDVDVSVGVFARVVVTVAVRVAV